MAYKIGNRMQTTFLPPAIDDYISDEDPAQVYDSFVEALDFNELGIPLTDYQASRSGRILSQGNAKVDNLRL